MLAREFGELFGTTMVTKSNNILLVYMVQEHVCGLLTNVHEKYIILVFESYTSS